MTVRAGATAAGNDVRLSGRSICSLAGVAAAWVSVTFERQHVGRVNCLTPRDAAEAEIAQRMHSCRASFALFERAASVDMRAQAHAFDAGPGTDSIVKARTSQPSSLRIQERMRSTPLRIDARNCRESYRNYGVLSQGVAIPVIGRRATL